MPTIMSNEILSLFHGFLGLIFLMAFSGAFTEIINKNAKSVKRIKIGVMIMLIVSIILFITGVNAYAIYRAPGGAREFIKESSTPWAHNVLMELKEFTGFYVLILMIVATSFVFHFKKEIITNKNLKKILTMLLILIMLWTFITFVFGAYITKVRAI